MQLELSKWLVREIGEEQADQVIAFTRTCIVADLDTTVLLLGETGRARLDTLKPVLTRQQLKTIQSLVPRVTASEAVVDYILRLVTRTRESQQCAFGLSPRASLGLLAAARAWAMLENRAYVIPEDVQAVLPAVVSHRLRASEDPAGHGGGALVQRLLNEVAAV